MGIFTRRNGRWEETQIFTRRNGRWEEAELYTRRNGRWEIINRRLTSIKGGTLTQNSANGHFRIRLVWELVSTNTNVTPNTSQVRLTLFWESISSGWSIWGAGGANTLTASRLFHIFIGSQNTHTVATHLNLRCNRFGASRQVSQVTRTFAHASDGTLTINIGGQLHGNNLSVTPSIAPLPITIANRNINVITR